MAYPTYQLYKKDFDKLVAKTRYYPHTVECLRDILVNGMRIVDAEAKYGIKKQAIQPRVKRLIQDAKLAGVKFKKIVERPQ